MPNEQLLKLSYQGGRSARVIDEQGKTVSHITNITIHLTPDGHSIDVEFLDTKNTTSFCETFVVAKSAVKKADSLINLYFTLPNSILEELGD